MKNYLIAMLAACFLSAPRAPVARAQNAPPQVLAATQAHLFVYESPTKLNSVSVAGTFNNWNNTANPLHSDADGKIWRATVSLPLGKNLYKFVLNGDNWIFDPKAAKNETDASGNTNSVLLLLPLDYTKPASPNDGITARSALSHQQAIPYLNYDRGQLTVSLRARPNDLQSVALKIGARRYLMTPISTDELYTHYTIQLPWDRKRDLKYTFELRDGDKTQEFGANGLGVSTRIKSFLLSAKKFQPFIVPSWVQHTVFYQIFPDRFANGDKSNDPPDVQPWDVTPTGFSRLGGDVAGVREHLPYLEKLGVSAVYFNPVFKSPSNHRYDAEDFKTIDPQFGTNQEFIALSKALQARHIRTVMDFVFNHTATTFAPFADIRKNGAASQYKDWYFIKSYPVKVEDPPNYVAWFGYAAMPKLNLLNPPTEKYMLNLVDYWKTQIPLSGLRLDVADEVDMRFWRALRTHVKALDPQMWIVGERWSDAAPWLHGDQWDAAMNYQFLFANRDFFAEDKTTSTEFTQRLMQIYNSYVPQVSRNMLNLLSSHDTARFLTVCKNNGDLHRLAATVQFTWPGAPSIYYGEELGMEGGNDPDNRRGMRWDLATPNNEMLRYYQRLIALRNDSPALQAGDPEILLTDDAKQSLVYARTLNDEMAIIAINRSDKTQSLEIALPKNRAKRTGLVDGLSGQRVAIENATMKVTLAPLKAAIFLPATGKFVALSKQD